MIPTMAKPDRSNLRFTIGRDGSKAAMMAKAIAPSGTLT